MHTHSINMAKALNKKNIYKKASEYNQEIPQSHCTVTYGTVRTSHRTLTVTGYQKGKLGCKDQEDRLSKTTSLFGGPDLNIHQKVGT